MQKQKKKLRKEQSERGQLLSYNLKIMNEFTDKNY